MEPCVVTHGNADEIKYLVDLNKASMEPCVVTHGNVVSRALLWRLLMLQWSHAWLRMEI